MDTTVFPQSLYKVLLVCGILYAVITLTTDIGAGLLTRGYRFDLHTANTFGGFGTPTRQFVLPIQIVAGFLLVAFGIGLWFSVEGNWVLRAMACLLVLHSILSMTAIAFFPFHPAEPASFPANRLNLMFMAPAVILFVLAILLGAIGYQDWLRWLSVGILLLFILGALVSIIVYRFFAGPGYVPSIGIQERTMIYSELLWITLQALVFINGT